MTSQIDSYNDTEWAPLNGSGRTYISPLLFLVPMRNAALPPTKTIVSKSWFLVLGLQFKIFKSRCLG